MKILLILAVSAIGFSNSAEACADKTKAKHEAKKELMRCINSWSHNGNKKKPEPTDDCATKMQAFVQASKDLKTCKSGN